MSTGEPHLGLGIDRRTEDAAKSFLARIEQDREMVAAFIFGSRARGDHDEGSDLDLAVIVPDKRRSLPVDFSVADCAYAVLEETGLQISPLLISTTAWKKPRMHTNPALLFAIKREGKLIAANLDLNSIAAAEMFVEMIRESRNVVAAYVIGSRARGDFHPGSDLDIVLIVQDIIGATPHKDVSRPTSAVFKKFGIVVSPVLVASAELAVPETNYERWLASTIWREGVKISFQASSL